MSQRPACLVKFISIDIANIDAEINYYQYQYSF